MYYIEDLSMCHYANQITNLLCICNEEVIDNL